MSDTAETPRTDGGAAPAAPRPNRLAGLEGPRGVGCLCVIFVHVAVHFYPSVLDAANLDFLGQALTFFFALSGFLLYLPYVQRLSRGRPIPPTRAYLRHRLMRVFPGYLAIFIVANFVLRAVYVENPATVSWGSGDAGTGMITDPVQLISNLTLTQTLFPQTLQTGLNPSWSLTTEWGFYLILPVVGIALFASAAARRRPLSAAVWPPAILLVIGVVTNTVVWILQEKYYPGDILQAYWGPNWVAVLSRSFLGLADTFAFGMLAAVVYVALVNGKFRSVPMRRIQWILGGAMIIGLIGSLALYSLNPRYLATVFAFASGAFILLIIAPSTRDEHSVIASITDWRPMRYIGMISLSVYLWHYPVLIMVTRLHLPIPSNLTGLFVAFAIVSAVTIVLGAITYRFVELPAMRHRGR